MYYESKIKYERMTDEGGMKMVAETYLVEAMGCTEAEKRLTEEMSSYISGDYEVTAVKKASYNEVFNFNDEGADLWYCCKLNIITLDEKTAKEKRTPYQVLLNAKSLADAKAKLDKQLGSTILDYNVKGITETQLMDVYFYPKSN